MPDWKHELYESACVIENAGKQEWLSAPYWLKKQQIYAYWLEIISREFLNRIRPQQT